MSHKLFVPTVMCNVVGGGDDNKYLMHRGPLLELQRRPVIVSVVARLTLVCFVGGDMCVMWGAGGGHGAVSCVPRAPGVGVANPRPLLPGVWVYQRPLALPTLRWGTLSFNPSPRARHGLRTWYGASSSNDRTMFSTSFLETFARKNEAYAATIAVESLPPSPDEFIPYFAGELATLFAGTHPIYDFPEGI